MTRTIPVLVPMENVNDETFILVRWLVVDGEEVTEGQAIAELETSKAVIELIAPSNGKIAFAADPGQEVAVGRLIAHLNLTGAPQSALVVEKAPSVRPIHEQPAAQITSAPLPGVRFSKKALELMDRNSLSRELFSSQTMVREEDVLTLLDDAVQVEPHSESVHFSVRDISLSGVTLPAALNTAEGGKLDPRFVDKLRGNRVAFSLLSSAEKCDQYRKNGALIGSDVELGHGTVIVSPEIVLGDGVRLREHSSVDCSERFIVGRLSSFRSGLSIEASTVIVGENIFGCRRVEISGGTTNPWAVLYVGDATFIGDDAILDVSRPIMIGKEVFVTQRSIVITHNIGHSILEGHENRFEPVVLEDCCQIGMNSTIYAGSRIGSAAVIASNSYVTSSIPAGKLAIGVPARVVRDAARPLDRKQQVQIAQRMVRDFREWLWLKGLDVTQVIADGFSLEHEGKRFQLVFTETYPGKAIALGSANLCVILTLEAKAGPPPGCALFDLLAKKIEGEGGIFVDSTREFLRKRGIRCQPRPWRYGQGLI